jgi:hypothetical protein
MKGIMATYKLRIKVLKESVDDKSSFRPGSARRRSYEIAADEEVGTISLMRRNILREFVRDRGEEFGFFLEGSKWDLDDLVDENGITLCEKIPDWVRATSETFEFGGLHTEENSVEFIDGASAIEHKNVIVYCYRLASLSANGLPFTVFVQNEEDGRLNEWDWWSSSQKSRSSRYLSYQRDGNKAPSWLGDFSDFEIRTLTFLGPLSALIPSMRSEGTFVFHVPVRGNGSVAPIEIEAFFQSSDPSRRQVKFVVKPFGEIHSEEIDTKKPALCDIHARTLDTLRAVGFWTAGMGAYSILDSSVD